MMFKVSPRKLRKIIEERIDNGIEITTINVARQLPRKSMIIKPVKHAAMIASRTTPLIEERTKQGLIKKEIKLERRR